MEQMITQFTSSIGGSLPSLLGSIIFLFVGWIIALLVGSLVRKLMATLNINGRFNSEKSGKGLDLEKLVARLAFWFVFIFAITGALDKLGLDAVSTPLANLLNQITSFIPTVIGASIIALIGWAIATVVKAGSEKLLESTSLDAKVSTSENTPAMSKTISSLLYWLVILMFIPMVLDKLNMKGILAPIQGMLSDMMAFIPNLIGAIIIATIGYFLAKVIREVVTNIVSGLNVQTIASKAGIKDASSLPKLAGTIVFFMIMMPVVILALEKLQLEAISRPATNMIDKIMTSLPNVFFAVVTLAVFYFVFRFVANIVSEILSNTGIDSLPEKMGLAQIFGAKKVSALVGTIILAYAMMFGVIEAANMIKFEGLSTQITQLMTFGSKIFFGAIILMVGFWIANLVSGVVARSQEGAEWLGTLVKVVIMGLVLAMGLNQMDIADSIVNMAFGFTLGSAAIAFALAFGLGGREAAARILKDKLDKSEKK